MIEIGQLNDFESYVVVLEDDYKVVWSGRVLETSKMLSRMRLCKAAGHTPSFESIEGWLGEESSDD